VTLIDAAAVLAYVGKASPTAEDTTRAGAIAATINAAITTRLDWPDGTGEDRYGVAIPARVATADETAELTEAALIAAAELWARRSAPFGITGYSDADGAAIRVGTDPILSVAGMVDRHRSYR
jgi:hypothetical protein